MRFCAQTAWWISIAWCERAWRIGEPGYSIKDLERFYMPARTTAVAPGEIASLSMTTFVRPATLAQPERSARLQSGRLPLHASPARLADRARQKNGPLASRCGKITTETAVGDVRNQRTMGGKSVKNGSARRQRSKPCSVRGIRMHRMPTLGNSWPISLASIAGRPNPAWWAFFDRQERSTEELQDDDECLGDSWLRWRGALCDSAAGRTEPHVPFTLCSKKNKLYAG